MYDCSCFFFCLFQSPRHNGHVKERFSGLWEFFYDNSEPGVREGEGERGDGEMGEGEGGMRNIRGFLFKRRKSPLKGWHKVNGMCCLTVNGVL